MADLRAMFGKVAATQEKKDAQAQAVDSGGETARVSGASVEESTLRGAESERGDSGILGAPPAPAPGNPFARKAVATGQPASTPAVQPATGSVPSADGPTRPALAGWKVPGSGGGNGSGVGLTPAVPAGAGGSSVESPAPPGGSEVVPQSVGAAVVPASLDSLDALAKYDVSDIQAEVGTPSGYIDETPATKPTRDLPEGLDKQQLQFIEQLDVVYEVIHDPSLMGDVIKSIMIELKSNPQYIKLVSPDDVRTMVRGMRNSMGLARIKKTEAKAKRAGGAAASRKSKAVDLDMLADLAALGIEPE